MKATKNFKTKFFGILSLAIFCTLTSVSSVSAGSGASANAQMYQRDGVSYLEGGVIVFGGYDFVPRISAYYELYRDGTYLGSKNAVSDNYYLSSSATALLTDGVHTQSGNYTMSWSGRVEDYYLFGGDWTDAGTVSYYKQ
ncbi:hypothetical protein [Paenibacillus caui]|uniref:hypothetical protein n=1 Tax=Paenibacillus caui TaxID=2873927 RepID=UPI001CA8E1A0|nr:hypothetical protein [Paenibacillus caui]